MGQMSKVTGVRPGQKVVDRVDRIVRALANRELPIDRSTFNRPGPDAHCRGIEGQAQSLLTGPVCLGQGGALDGERQQPGDLADDAEIGGPERMRTGAFNDQDTGCLGHLAEWNADLAPDLGHDGDVIGIGIDVGNQLAYASPGHSSPDPGIDVEPPQRMLVADLMDEGDSARLIQVGADVCVARRTGQGIDGSPDDGLKSS